MRTKEGKKRAHILFLAHIVWHFGWFLFAFYISDGPRLGRRVLSRTCTIADWRKVQPKTILQWTPKNSLVHPKKFSSATQNILQCIQKILQCTQKILQCTQKKFTSAAKKKIQCTQKILQCIQPLLYKWGRAQVGYSLKTSKSPQNTTMPPIMRARYDSFLHFIMATKFVFRCQVLIYCFSAQQSLSVYLSGNLTDTLSGGRERYVKSAPQFSVSRFIIKLFSHVRCPTMAIAWNSHWKEAHLRCLSKSSYWQVRIQWPSESA